MERKAAAHEDTSEYKKEITVLRVEKLKQSSLFETMKERCRKVKPDIEQKLNEEEWRSLIRLIDSLFSECQRFYERKYVGSDKNRNQDLLSQFLGFALKRGGCSFGSQFRFGQ